GAGRWHLARQQPGSVADRHHPGRVPPPDVVHAEEARYLHRGVDLLLALAHRRLGRVLLAVDEASRQAPETVAGLGAAAAQHALTGAVLDHDHGHHLRVAPEYEVTPLAGLQLLPFDGPHDERFAAVQAVVRHGPSVGGGYT